ncbi:MAG TPA: bifunctional aldolase/short-chain dehydrogenase [Anaerolineaceae bacterium]
MVENLWRADEYKQNPGLDGLVYRSNLLGRDRSVANVFGGNTSAKIPSTDHLGRPLEVLWVKGSGSDLATIREKDFPGLRLADMLPLIDRESMSDEEMVDYLSHCVYALNRPRQSIETLLHAFLPARHIDHTHPDAVISLASTPSGRELCQKLWGARAVWVDYEQPGFSLSKHIALACQANPQANLVVMGKHGLITWGESSESCYASTIETIQEAEEFIESRRSGKQVFGAAVVPQLSSEESQKILLEVLPALRGALSGRAPKILRVDAGKDVLEFVNSARAEELSQIGAACPDHLLRTKRVPLFVDWRPEQGSQALVEKLKQGVEAYADQYRPYFEEYKQASGFEMDPTPRVVLVPGLGMITAAENFEMAEIVRGLYHRAIRVIENSESLDRFTSLSAEEAYRFEFWPLELYKLSLKPPAKEFEGRVVVITGAADGIGKGAALQFAQEGAHVVICDINLPGAEKVAGEIVGKHGPGRALAVRCDVSDEEAVRRAFEEVVLSYGGLDVVVSNAGIFRGSPVEETSLKEWSLVQNINGTGYFLISREAFRLWRQQGTGGNLVFVGSKNSVRAGKNVIAYSAAKAAELHMARCLAEEGGEAGIRVNTVLPDAVLHGSSLFTDDVKKWRADSYGIKPEELEDYYLNRCILKIPVYPEHVAEAIYFLASSRSSRTTGGVITVDGGVNSAFVR